MAAALPSAEVIAYLVLNFVLAGLLVVPTIIVAGCARRGGRFGVGAAVLLGLAGGGLAWLAGPGDWRGGLAVALTAGGGFGGLGIALWHYGNQPLAIGRLFAGWTALFFVAAVGPYGLTQMSAGLSPVDIGEYWRQQIGQSFDQYLVLLSQQIGGEGLSNVQALRDQQGALVTMIFNLSPALIAWSCVTLVLLNLLLSRRLLPAVAGLELNRWRAPDAAIWLVLLPALGLVPYLLLPLLGRDAARFTATFYLSLNVVLIALAPYVMQGLGIMSFFMKRWRFPRFLRGLTYLFVLTQGLFALVPALGLMEFWTDWRGRAAAKPETDKNDKNTI